MIEINNVCKKFDSVQALMDVSLKISDGSVFGLLGTNGSGKSTLLRLMSGILRPDSGEIRIDNEPVFDNETVKETFFFLSDEQYFFPEATPESILKYYRLIYPAFREQQYLKLLDAMNLDKRQKISNLSKGMKKQVSILLGICSNTKYLFCDETFDGLDPVMRQAIKSIFAKEVTERNFTPVIASHNLRELEDICDSVGILHKGGVLLSKDIEDIKVDIHKVQFVLPEGRSMEQVLDGFELLITRRQGKLITATIRGSQQSITERMKKEKPVFYEILALTLEEIFINETEAAGYDIKNII